MPSIRVRIPATTANLGPGFDALGLALQLHNFVSLEATPGEADEIIASGEGAAALAEGFCSDNIALIAAKALLARLGGEAPPLRLTLENSIPLARGLGSSSAARVGALVAANEWARCNWGHAAEQDTLLALATQQEGHPDNVAPALLGGLVVCATEAEDEDAALPRVQALRVAAASFPRLVVFIPESELETKEARAVLPDAIFRKDATFNLARASLLTATLAAGAWRERPDLLREALKDRLHQDLRASLMPGYEATCRAAIEAGALGATLSGAGPSILAWLSEETAVSEVCSAMEDAAAKSEVFGRAREVLVDEEGCVVTQ